MFGTEIDSWVAVEDFDGDRILDVATSNGAADAEDEFVSPIVSVRLGRGDGTFGPATAFGTGSHAASLASADMDRDGRADLVIANFGPDESNGPNVAVLPGRGDGTFGEQHSYRTANSPYTVALADQIGRASCRERV